MPQVKTKITSLGTVRPPIKDLELDRLELQAAGVKALLNRVLSDATLEATIEGASTLTLVISDEPRVLIRTKLVKEKSTIVLDNVQYRLVKVSRDGAQMTLIFEETAVNVLREHDSPRKANRENTTRAQFVRTLVQEPKDFKITFRCPELNERQPTEAPKT